VINLESKSNFIVFWLLLLVACADFHGLCFELEQKDCLKYLMRSEKLHFKRFLFKLEVIFLYFMIFKYLNSMDLQPFISEMKLKVIFLQFYWDFLLFWVFQCRLEVQG